MEEVEKNNQEEIDENEVNGNEERANCLIVSDEVKKLRECDFNILAFYGLCSKSQSVAETLGCYSRVFFSTVIVTGLIEQDDVCNGCLLSSGHAHKLDPEHEKAISMGCSLSPLLHGSLMLLLFRNKNGRAKIQEMVQSSDVSYLMMNEIHRLFEGQEYNMKVFKKMMDGSLTRMAIMPWKWDAIQKVNGYLESGVVRPVDLVYKPGGRSQKINEVAIKNMVKECLFWFREVNGDCIKGYCYGCCIS